MGSGAYIIAELDGSLETRTKSWIPCPPLLMYQALGLDTGLRAQSPGPKTQVEIGGPDH